MKKIQILAKILINRKKRIFILGGIGLFAAIILITVVYGNIARSSGRSNISRDPGLLIKKLDNLLESVKRKSNINGQKENSAYLIDKMVLQGIVWTTQAPLAIIENRIVAAGDEIRNIKILEIEEKSITLRNRQGQTRIIHFYEKK